VNRQVHDRGEPDGRECWRRTLYKELRKHLGEVFRRLASQKENRILDGDLMPYHVHMLIAIPPKYAVSQVIGFIKDIKCNPFGSSLRREETKFCRATLLGAGLLCFDGGSR
jgi:REP element-mobilizing transposase RayT